MSKDNALTTTTGQEFQLATIDNEMATAIREELDSLGQIPFNTLKIPAGSPLRSPATTPTTPKRPTASSA